MNNEQTQNKLVTVSDTCFVVTLRPPENADTPPKTHLGMSPHPKPEGQDPPAARLPSRFVVVLSCLAWTPVALSAHFSRTGRYQYVLCCLMLHQHTCLRDRRFAAACMYYVIVLRPTDLRGNFIRMTSAYHSLLPLSAARIPLRLPLLLCR